MADTGGSYSGGATTGPATPAWDAEPVCYTLLATGDTVHSGTKRHDDSFPPPGFRVFDAGGQVVNTSQGGYTEVPCDQHEECCPEVIGEGCWDSGSASGSWVSIRAADGTVSVIDPTTGNAVAAANVVPCPPPAFGTFFQTVDGDSTANASFTVPGASADLTAWSVRSFGNGVSVSVGTSTVTLNNGDVVESATPPDEGGILNDAVQVVAPTGVTARVMYQRRA